MLQMVSPIRPHQTARPARGGGALSQIHFLLIRTLDSQQTPSNGSRQPLGHTDTLNAPLRSWPLCGANIQSYGLSAVRGGDWGQTPWAHPLVLHASRKPARFLLLLLLFIHVIGWSGDVLILDSYQECPCELSSATHPWGMKPFLIGTQRARLDCDYACKYTCSIFLVRFYPSVYFVFYFQTWCLEICDYIVAPLYVLLKGRRRSH